MGAVSIKVHQPRTAHLLGKKSWNPYSPANIARVRRDEEAARAREEAEEQRMQAADAARRLAILRGELPLPIEETERTPSGGGDLVTTTRRRHDGSSGRKRKRPGEDDTDYEMRLARGREPSPPSLPLKPATALYDSKGHISLFAEEEVAAAGQGDAARSQQPSRTRHEKNETDSSEPYQVRLADAAGRDSGGRGAWYATADGEASAALVPTRNVFGREDPQRKAREAARLDASDPLAMMKRGAKMVRELEKERKREVEEREREIRLLEEEEERERRRERKRRREEEERERRYRRDREREDARRRDDERTRAGSSASPYTPIQVQGKGQVQG
ncbi:hypothetical protein VTJ49DRAFT_5271 [Mycothermus thermophilus]|uniref:CBF1-interacting co-repressor CIR N-terminal domain-containing protein n=1 Tax=Humicola insolens TaxID=85995 RepID=A0ABR3VKL3_HUMIN